MRNFRQKYPSVKRASETARKIRKWIQNHPVYFMLPTSSWLVCNKFPTSFSPSLTFPSVSHFPHHFSKSLTYFLRLSHFPSPSHIFPASIKFPLHLSHFSFISHFSIHLSTLHFPFSHCSFPISVILSFLHLSKLYMRELLL